MQTIAVQIQDSYATSFMNYVSSHSENISIVRDSNLELNSYFYEKQNQLQQDLEEIENGTAEMILHNDLWANINKH